MTEKLYYNDAYIKEFEAEVLSCRKCDTGYDIILDKTAFFPEEAGQYSDTGYIGCAEVKHVFESEGIIHHIADSPIPVGEALKCKLDFDVRYEKMQCHTGEHILSGLFHKLFACTNVGFHLSNIEFTIDLDKELSESEISRVEELANRVIYENTDVRTEFPSADALASLEYRSKLDLNENVRIVTIGEYDSCACCAPHVAKTGEIGVIKILDTMRHRGGTRLFVTAGIRAFRDYRARSEAVKRVSALISVPRLAIAEGVEKLLADTEELKLAYRAARQELFLKYAEDVPETGGNAVLYFPTAEQEDLRVVANAALEKVGGILVLLLGEEHSFKYLIVSNSCDLRALAPEINKSLGGRGGGKTAAIQGSFSSSLCEIKEYFNK